MKTAQEYITEAHASDLQWRKDLDFYKEEISIFKKRLDEIAFKNTSKDIKLLVSHFENQFIINLNVIDEINHLINLKEDKIAADLKENAVAFEHRSIAYLSEVKGQVEIFTKLYASLKTEFNSFASQVL